MALLDSSAIHSTSTLLPGLDTYLPFAMLNVDTTSAVTGPIVVRCLAPVKYCCEASHHDALYHSPGISI